VEVSTSGAAQLTHERASRDEATPQPGHMLLSVFMMMGIF
jgi:hypothetical protein